MMGTYMTAERACFSAGQKNMDDLEVRFRTQNYSDEQYCRLTYSTLDELNSCVSKAKKTIPKGFQFLEKFVEDFETMSQYRTKSIIAMQNEHDGLCVRFPDFLFTQPENYK